MTENPEQALSEKPDTYTLSTPLDYVIAGLTVIGTFGVSFALAYLIISQLF